jgi:hypothetical protein
MSVQTYIEKMVTKCAGKWDKELEQMGNSPLPMPAREDFWRKFLNSEGPKLKDGSADPEYQGQMRKALGFVYRNGVGEIIYAMVTFTCRPDISTSTVHCAKNSTCPHEVHNAGVKHILKYL